MTSKIIRMAAVAGTLLVSACASNPNQTSRTAHAAAPAPKAPEAKSTSRNKKDAAKTQVAQVQPPVVEIPVPAPETVSPPVVETPAPAQTAAPVQAPALDDVTPEPSAFGELKLPRVDEKTGVVDYVTAAVMYEAPVLYQDNVRCLYVVSVSPGSAGNAATYCYNTTNEGGSQSWLVNREREAKPYMHVSFNIPDPKTQEVRVTKVLYAYHITPPSNRKLRCNATLSLMDEANENGPKKRVGSPSLNCFQSKTLADPITP